jgi:hypothetical protein
VEWRDIIYVFSALVLPVTLSIRNEQRASRQTIHDVRSDLSAMSERVAVVETKIDLLPRRKDDA